MLVKHMSNKICIIGDGGVGKTSLIRRFVYDTFGDKYLTTIGTKVTRKVFILNYPERNVQVKLNTLIWDIMGQKAFRSLLHEAYFHGTQGVLIVCNLTQEETLRSLDQWIESVKKNVGEIPAVLLANKSDLEDQIHISEEELKDRAAEINAQYLYTSAKTGLNVDKAFKTIGRAMLKHQLKLC